MKQKHTAKVDNNHAMPVDPDSRHLLFRLKH